MFVSFTLKAEKKRCRKKRTNLQQRKLKIKSYRFFCIYSHKITMIKMSRILALHYHPSGAVQKTDDKILLDLKTSFLLFLSYFFLLLSVSVLEMLKSYYSSVIRCIKSWFCIKLADKNGKRCVNCCKPIFSA